MMNNINFIHWGLWSGFMVLSNIPLWWSYSFKPAQRAAAVYATKGFFTPTNPTAQKLVSKYGLHTKASLEISSIIECGYKHKNHEETVICLNTATIKYGSAFVCESATMSMAPSFVIKPACFAVGTISSTAYKMHMTGKDAEFTDIVFTAIATGARELEYWLPQKLEAYGIPMEYTFYVTTAIEGAISAAYIYFVSTDSPSKQLNIKEAALTNYSQEYTNINLTNISIINNQSFKHIIDDLNYTNEQAIYFSQYYYSRQETGNNKNDAEEVSIKTVFDSTYNLSTSCTGVCKQDVI